MIDGLNSVIPPASDAVCNGRVPQRRQRYDHPHDVLATALDDREKRAILDSLASDLFAVGSRPHLRQPPGFLRPIRYQDMLNALRSLAEDDEPGEGENLSGRSQARIKA